MEYLGAPLSISKTALNTYFANKEPWQISAITASTVVMGFWLYNFVFQDESIVERGKKVFFKCLKKIPKIKKELDEKLLAIRNDFQDDIVKRNKDVDYILSLPKISLPENEILDLMEKYLKLGSYNWKNGRVSGSVYYDHHELAEFIKEVYGKASYTNPLHPDIFPGLCKMEAEIIRMVAELFHGDSNVTGTMTTGGTESILLACKAYRDYGREFKGIKKPEMVVPFTAHAAFSKACQYFKIKLISVPVDPVTTQVNITAMKRAISSNTIMLAGSAPNFPYGTVDDIGAISDLGLKYNIPVHVDSCLGGFLTIFMEEAGFPFPICDFRLPGVTSISADTHKYGFAPKGTSVILYRNLELLHHQYSTTTDWPGGVYGSPTISGSRAGGSIAACWATLLRFGKDGYVETTRDIIHTSKYIEKGLRRIQGIFIFGQPATSVVAIGSKVFDIYRLQAALTDKGWNLNILQFPSGIHFTTTHLHTKGKIADQFIADVQQAVSKIMEDPGLPTEGKMAVYGFAQGIPDRSIVSDVTHCYLDAMFYTPKNSSI